MSFMGRAGKVLSLATIVALFLSVAPGAAYDPEKFPGKGSRADWERACALSDQAVELAKQGKHQEAQSLYKSSLAIYPMAVTYFNYGKDFKREGKTQESIEMYKRAIEMAPDYYQAYVSMSAAFLTQKNYAKAEVACKNALRINPGTAGAMINLADVCMGTGRLSEARKWLDNAGKCQDVGELKCKSALEEGYKRLRLMSKTARQGGN